MVRMNAVSGVKRHNKARVYIIDDSLNLIGQFFFILEFERFVAVSEHAQILYIHFPAGVDQLLLSEQRKGFPVGKSGSPIFLPISPSVRQAYVTGMSSFRFKAIKPATPKDSSSGWGRITSKCFSSYNTFF